MGFAQLSTAELEEYKAKLEKAATHMRGRMEAETKDYLSETNKKLTIDFAIDTFKVEQLLRFKLDHDYSTQGMTQATYDAEVGYDQLLNRYYQQLMQKMNAADKKLLRRSQRNWLAFRDSERAMNAALAKEEYSGGGTIQQLFIASRHLNLTKHRVLELYAYLSRNI